MITNTLNDQNHILENCIGSVIYFFILTQVPFVYMERAGFMTCTAANHQGAIKEPAASLFTRCETHPVGTNMVQYLNHETSQNPHVLVLGDKENSFQVFIIFNGEAMEQETLPQAVDLCFKLFSVYDINYPKPSAPIWEFLEDSF